MLLMAGHFSSHIGDEAFRDLQAIYISYLISDVRSGHTTRIETQNDLFNLFCCRFSFGYKTRLKLTVAVSWNIDLDGTFRTFHFLNEVPLRELPELMPLDSYLSYPRKWLISESNK